MQSTNSLNTLISQIEDLNHDIFMKAFCTGSTKLKNITENISKSIKNNSLTTTQAETLLDYISNNEISDLEFSEIKYILSKDFRIKRKYSRIKEKNSKVWAKANPIEQIQMTIIENYFYTRLINGKDLLPKNRKGINAVTLRLVRLLNDIPFSATEFKNGEFEQFPIFAYRLQKLELIANYKLKTSDLFICKDKTYHSNNAGFGYNGFTRKYIFNTIGQQMRQAIELSNEMILTLTKDIKEVDFSVSIGHILVHTPMFPEFIKALGTNDSNGIKKINILGKVKDAIIIENKILSNIFNRTYTTFTQMSKKARALCLQKEIIDIEKHGINTVLQSSKYNFCKNGIISGLSGINPEKEYPEVFKAMNGQWEYIKSFEGLNISNDAAKKSLIAALYGARDRGVIETVLKYIDSEEDKKKFLAIYKESRWYKAIKEIRKMKSRLAKQINYKAARKRFSCPKDPNKSSGAGRLVAYFVSYYENIFRVVVKKAFSIYGLSFIQVHDAIYSFSFYSDKIKSIIPLIIEKYEFYTNFKLKLHIN